MRATLPILPLLEQGGVALSHVAVDLAAMAEADNHDNQDIVLDSVDDSIVADTHTIEIVETGQTLIAGRSGVVCEGADSGIDAIAGGLRKDRQLAHCAFGKLDGVAHLLTIKAEFPPCDVVGDGTFARDFRKGLGGLFAVDPVFEFLEVRFEELEVGYGNDRGQRLAIVFEEYWLAVFDALDGVGEVFVRTLEHPLRHMPDSFSRIIARELMT